MFPQKIVRATWSDFLAWKKHTGAQLIGTSPASKTDYRAVEYNRQTILLMGGERRGLSLEQQMVCDRIVKIPMVGEVDSLNLAIATSVLLYEVFNQRESVT